MHCGTELSRRILTGTMCWLLLTGAVAAADMSIESVQIGVGGITRPGVWANAHVTVLSDTAINSVVEIEASDPTGSGAVYRSAEVSLEPSRSRRIDCYFMPGRLEQSISVRVISAEDGLLLASKRLVGSDREGDERDFTIVRHEKPVWLVAGTIGASQSSRTRTASATEAISKRGVLLVQADSDTPCLSDARALSTVDTVVLSGSFNFSPEQASALRNWTADGGHLVIACGTRVDELQGSSISDWVLKRSELVSSSLSDLSGLEAFARSTFRIPIVARIRGSIIKAEDGIDLVSGIDGALLTRSAYGFGRVTLIGVDLDRPPLSRWRALDSFVTVAADLASTEDAEDEIGNRISRTGITELATQFHSGLETIPQTGERSTLSVLGLVLLFLVVIGPLDYVLVHRVLKKPGMTWVTFPMVVVAAGLLASATAKSTNGSLVRSAICDIVDIESTSGFARQTVWSTIYSPVHRRYEVEVVQTADSQLVPALSEATPASAHASGWLSWAAIPETNFGGMYRSAGMDLGRPGYQFRDRQSGIENLPVAAASDRVLKSDMQWVVPRELFESNLTQAGTGHLSRDSSFTHHLPGAIDDWMLVYGNRAYYHRFQSGDILGSTAIEPGVPWQSTGSSTTGRELKSFLTGSTFQRTGKKSIGGAGDEFEFSLVDWNPRESDLLTVLRMITFHDVSGGQSYSGLQNSEMRTLELSDSLPLDRAILVGRLNVPLSTLQLDGRPVEPDRRETFIRVLLPVKDAVIARSLPKFEDK